MPIGGDTFAFIGTDITPVAITLSIHLQLQIKELQEKLQRQTESLEVAIHERTAELRGALEARSRFLATISHGNQNSHSLKFQKFELP